jgi:hypothetical protein
MTRSKKKLRRRSRSPQVLTLQRAVEESGQLERADVGEGEPAVRGPSAQGPRQGESGLGPCPGAGPSKGTAKRHLSGVRFAGKEPLASPLHGRRRGKPQARGDEHRRPERQQAPGQDAAAELQRASAAAPRGASMDPRPRAAR